MYSQQLANRLREVFLDGHWVANTNYKKLLAGISWQQATMQVGSLNTIAHLVFHINYYLSGVLNVLKGGPLEIRDQFSFDLEPICSQADWNNLLNQLLANAELFVKQVGQLDDVIMNEVFVDEKYGSYLRNLEGMIEHSYYHLGQIAIIRKLLESNNSDSM